MYIPKSIILSLALLSTVGLPVLAAESCRSEGQDCGITHWCCSGVKCLADYPNGPKVGSFVYLMEKGISNSSPAPV